MSFYFFSFDSFTVIHKRGNIPDDDVVTFTVLVNQLDRGHGSATFPALATNTKASTSDRADTGLLAYPARNRLNMSERWKVGPLEIRPGENVSVVYTGTNVSDEQLSSLDTQGRDELEIKILNYVAKKYVELIAGLEFGSDIGSALSEAFDQAFKNPVGDLIGYRALGPCDGPVFSDAVQFTAGSLAQAGATSFTHTYTDEATHDTNVCGHVAETSVVFSVSTEPFVSVRGLVAERFPSRYPTEYGPGLRQYGKRGTTISIKSMLGVRP